MLSDESPAQGIIRPIPGGRFILHEYQGSLAGKGFEGIAIFGYSFNDKKLHAAWIDSFHMGTDIMFSTGAQAGGKVSFMGAYAAGPGSPEQWRWRTEMESTGEDQLVITANNITPEGEEAKTVETIYANK